MFRNSASKLWRKHSYLSCVVTHYLHCYLFAYTWITISLRYYVIILPITLSDIKLVGSTRTVLWLRRFIAYLWNRRPGIAPKSVRVGFVLDKVVSEQVFLRAVRFYLSISFHRSCPYSYIIWRKNIRHHFVSSSERDFHGYDYANLS